MGHTERRREVEAAIDFLVLELALNYVDQADRYVAVLAVGYRDEEVQDAEAAAKTAIELVKGSISEGTRWVVYDRKTGQIGRFVQGEFTALEKVA